MMTEGKYEIRKGKLDNKKKSGRKKKDEDKVNKSQV